jgi:hypothetical protein
MSLRAAGVQTFAGEVELLELPDAPPLEVGEVALPLRLEAGAARTTACASPFHGGCCTNHPQIRCVDL